MMMLPVQMGMLWGGEGLNQWSIHIKIQIFRIKIKIYNILFHIQCFDLRWVQPPQPTFNLSALFLILPPLWVVWCGGGERKHDNQMLPIANRRLTLYARRFARPWVWVSLANVFCVLSSRLQQPQGHIRGPPFPNALHIWTNAIVKSGSAVWQTNKTKE